MARIKNGILGAFSGKVGTVVGYIVGDKAFMRSLPDEPKRMTAKELINQDKFKLVQDYISPITDLVRAGFKDYYTPTGGVRAAFSYTRKVALVTDDAGFYIDPALVKISGGDLPQAENPVVALEATDFIKISWDKEDMDSELGKHQLIVSAYNMEKFEARVVIFDGAYRREGSMCVELPKTFRGKQIDVYIGFINGERTAQSDSQYLGRIEVAV